MAGELVPDRRDLRASHEDRDRVAEQLRVAAGDGRLTADELDERLEIALTARTYGELEALVTDLPPAGGAVPTAAAREMVRIDVHSGSANREGAWIVPRKMEVTVGSGAVRLDFTAAAISAPDLEITAAVRSGSLTLIVPLDVLVDTDDVSVHSGSVKQESRPTAGAAGVRLRIRVAGQVRSGSIKVRGPRPPRRSFLGWLLRRPRPALPALPR